MICTPATLQTILAALDTTLHTNGYGETEALNEAGDPDTDYARGIRAARAIVLAVQWRPIESAPTDKGPLLLFSPDSIEPRIALCCWLDFADGSGGWYDYWNESAPELDAAPSHWMPLPEPPPGAPPTRSVRPRMRPVLPQAGGPQGADPARSYGLAVAAGTAGV